MAEKVRVFNPLIKLLLKAGIPLGTRKLEELLKDGTFLEKISLAGMRRFDLSVDVLSDDNPDNRGQLGKVWMAYLNEDVIPALDQELAPVLAEIKNEKHRALIVKSGAIIVGALALLTDEVKENAAQLREHFLGFLKGDEFRTLAMGSLNEVLLTFVKDEGVLSLVITVFGALFDILQGIPLEPETARLLSGEKS